MAPYIATSALFLLSLLPAPLIAQKSLFLDHDGKMITNNEFVDIRLANIHYKDATIVNTLPNGVTEFRLQKIPQEGMAAPAFTVKTLDGRTVSLESLKGKVVVLNLWFIGCAVCRAHKPKLNDLKSSFAADENVVFLAMTADPASAVRDYLKKEPFDYIQAADIEAPIKLFRFSGYPKNIVINKKGEIVYWRGPIAAWDKFKSVIQDELAKP